MEPITTELRELAQDINWTEIIDHIHARNVLDGDWLDSWHKAFDARCDAIDAVHAQLERENEELRKYPIWAPESHYMLLPKDADGVPIHVGDVMEWCATSGDWPKREVEGVREGMFATYEPAIGKTVWLTASDYHHHKPDTWEQIIEDALDGYHDTDFDALVARCKTLAGDADE